MPIHELRTVQTRSELDAVIESQWAAFANDPMRNAMYRYDPSEPASLPAMIAQSKEVSWTLHCADENSTWVYVIDTEDPRSSSPSTMYVLGSAQWRIHRKNPFANGVPEFKFSSWPDGSAEQKFVGRWVRDLMLSRARHMARPQAALSWMAVRPDAQRRGVGTLLMKWGMDKADELGLEGNLGATKDGEQLYIRWGFRKVCDIRPNILDLAENEEQRAFAEKVLPGGYWDAITMWRPVRGICEDGWEEMLKKRAEESTGPGWEPVVP